MYISRDGTSTLGKKFEMDFYYTWRCFIILYTRSDVRHIKTYGSYIHYYVENGELIFIVFKHNYLNI